MRAILAKSSGFCMGVKRAVDTAKKVYGKGVYVLGEIIHNESVIRQIESLGTTFINDIDEIDEGTLIIRSHGVGKAILEKLAKKNINVINCTCPFVIKTQKIIEEYYSKGYRIIITGEKNHPEVVGLNGWCENTALILDENYSEIDLKSDEKVCIVSQTTYSVEKFQKILEFFKKKSLKTLEIFYTICYTTRERQEEAEILSKTCDAMVVVGGKNSSNTKKLMRICQGNCENVYFISNPDELDYKKFINYKKVGIVAGASTPNEQSMEVFLKMESTEVKSSVMEEALTAIDEQKFKRGQIITATI
ncbi:MAG: 4-hydroxy-3-methylbut-2-enyl diphosphate reductase, partial [Clostridiales bacterium]|nr:4-hydroxy-3-methylbut-2-enyl diphosphate reductase [Clostridiales bacterium]